MTKGSFDKKTLCLLLFVVIISACAVFFVNICDAFNSRYRKLPVYESWPGTEAWNNLSPREQQRLCELTKKQAEGIENIRNTYPMMDVLLERKNLKTEIAAYREDHAYRTRGLRFVDCLEYYLDNCKR